MVVLLIVSVAMMVMSFSWDLRRLLFDTGSVVGYDVGDDGDVVVYSRFEAFGLRHLSVC